MDDAFVKEVVSGVEIYGLGGAVLLFMVIVGEIFMRWREGKAPMSKEGANSALFFGIFGSAAEAVFYNALLIAALWPVYHLTPLRIEVSLWTLPIYVIIGELAYYWYHRVGHEVRLCWADHSIHHSAGTYDFTVNLRHVPFQALYRWVVWAPFIALGFHPLIFVLFTTTGPSFQTFCHTTRIGRFHPWFEWLFITPKNHGVHHASNEPYLDKNYGGLTMIWDHVFGTYQRMEDHIAPDYGITYPLQTANPIKVVLHEFVPLFRDFAAAPSFGQKMGVLFGRPGHTFELPRGSPPRSAASQLQAAE